MTTVHSQGSQVYNSRNYRPGIYTFRNEPNGPAILRFAFRPDVLFALFIAGLWLTVLLTRLTKTAPFLYGGF